MTKIFVVRHAEADGNIYRRVHGHYDGYITQNGYRQIEALRARFADIHVDAVYSSDLFRTSKTAEAIYGGKDIPYTRCPEFREINLGIWEDLTWGELMQSFPEAYDAWTYHPQDFKIEESESYAEVYTRFKKKLDEVVLENPDKTIAIVSHGSAIRGLLCGLSFNGDMNHLMDIKWCDNTAVACIEADENLNYEIIYQNDNSHLAELSTLNRQKWWREGDRQSLYNLWFSKARFPEDTQKACDYHRDAWFTIFGAGGFSPLCAKLHVENLYSSCEGAIAFGYREDEEVGAIMLDGNARLVPDGGHISLLYLNENIRSQGFGIQFLGYAVSIYRALGRKFLTIRVAEHNEHAIAFYKKYGFEEFDRENDGESTQILMKMPIYYEL